MSAGQSINCTEDTLPEFEENGDYEVIFTFTQGEEGEYKERSIHFDTYDT